MKKIILLLLILFSTIVADSVLLVKKGWQLIGSSTSITDMSQFKYSDVEQIWHFDSKTQKWLGYSPDSSIQARMRDKNISKLTSLKSWHGFWIKSKRDWALVLPKKTLNKVPNKENSPNDIIELKKGWNLISLPIDSVVSPDIFEGLTVWRYNPNSKWELYDSTDTQENFPPIEYIKNSDALWVKAQKDTNISVAKESSKLHNFLSKEEMKEYIKDMYISNRSHWGIEPLYLNSDYDLLALPTSEINDVDVEDSDGSSTSQVRDATNTNIQESGVDEADILKHNNKYIFYVVKNSDKPHIDITSFDKLSHKDNSIIDTISFPDNRNIESLYLVDNRLVVLSSKYNNNKVVDMGDSDEPLPNYPTVTANIDIFDISNINHIRNISSTKIDGNSIDSRVIGSELYIITSFTPQIDITYPKKYITLSPLCQEYFNRDNYDIYPVTEETSSNETQISPAPTDQKDNDYNPNRYASCYNIQIDREKRYYRYDYDNPIVTPKQIIPQIENNSNAKEDLVIPQKLYAPKKINQFPNITTISNISILDGEYKGSNSFIGDSSTQYASAHALYLVSTQYPVYYDFYNYKERSIIYKFDFDNQLKYKGKGEVYGHTLNQFSLSEYNSILRVATTEGFSWRSSGTKNSIYTLKNIDQKLKVQGILSGLGKEGETIKSVRFMGDKAFVVTFRQTDPFYTIDLSDPTAPQKVGELQVNGYSAYLHPVGDDKILGVGEDADSEGRLQGLKLELFDISDLANPISLDSIKYPKDTESELLYNHKALAYRNSDNLFAFPYSVYGNHTSNYTIYNYLGVYQIKNSKIDTYPAIKSTNRDWGDSRGLIFDINGTTFVSFFTKSDIVTKELNSTKK